MPASFPGNLYLGPAAWNPGCRAEKGLRSRTVPNCLFRQRDVDRRSVPAVPSNLSWPRIEIEPRLLSSWPFAIIGNSVHEPRLPAPKDFRTTSTL